MQQDEALKRLRSNDTALTTLNLMRNRLGAVGGAAVAGALERNTTLTTLDLRYNYLGEGFGAAVAVALERNTMLTSLDLGENGLEEKTFSKLKSLMEGRKAVETNFIPYVKSVVAP